MLDRLVAVAQGFTMVPEVKGLAVFADDDFGEPTNRIITAFGFLYDLQIRARPENQFMAREKLDVDFSSRQSMKRGSEAHGSTSGRKGRSLKVKFSDTQRAINSGKEFTNVTATLTTFPPL